ncbi:uncharacterized protein LOC143036869 [Oratosquilla oratoria]|uniref:uncharacterized protein LOC143036869 n=1 Tax=Oratosquilla oratoria TaxID=337810 RepID=UPI003F773C2E
MECDQSILAKPGMGPCNDTEWGEVLEMSPQATSTAVIKKTRQDLVDDIVRNGNEVARALTDEESKRTEGTRPKPTKSSKSYHDLSSVPSLNIENMKGLSSSFILVDSDGKIPSIKISSHSESESGCETDMEVEAPPSMLAPEDLATSEFSDYECSSDNGGWGKAGTSEEEQGGLPSCLLEPKHTELTGCTSTQEYVWGNLTNPMENTWEHQSEIVDDKKVDFQPEQISAQFPIFQKGLTVSDLQSNCHRSLNGFDESVEEREGRFSIGSQEDDFEGNGMLEGESFRAVSTGFFDKEEKEWEKKGNKNKDFTHSIIDNTWDLSNCSGIMEKSNITVRPSWISPEKGLIKPGTKVPFEEFMKLRSEPFGSLDNKSEERPHFGFPADSPPNIQAPKPLIELSYTVSPPLPQVNLEESDSKDEKSLYTSDCTNSTESSSRNLGESTFKNSKLSNPKSSPSSGEGAVTTSTVSCKSNESFYRDVNGRQKEQGIMSAKDFPGQPAGETVKVQKTKELEKILKEIKGDISAENWLPIWHMAFQCNNPKLMVEKISQLLKQTSVQESTFDVTDMDMSTAFKEMHSQRLALQSESQARDDESGFVKPHEIVKSRPVNLRDGSSQSMENVRNPDMMRIAENPSKKRLHLYKTESLPLAKGDIGNKECNSRNLCMPAGAQKGTFLLLPGIENSSQSGFESSLFLPRQQIVLQMDQEPKQKVEEMMKNLQVSQLNSQMQKEATAMNARSQPSMGLSHVDKTSSDAAAFSDYNSSQDLAKGLRVANGTKLGGLGRTEREELDGSAYNSRSISVPLGLQDLGTESQLHSMGYLQSHIRQHSLEDVAGRNPLAHTGLLIPSEIQFPTSCLLNFASSAGFTFCNPMRHWLKLSLTVTRETINGQPCSSLVSFKPSQCIEPQQTCDVSFMVCSPVTGNYVAHVEVSIFNIGDLAKDPSCKPLLRKMMKVSADVEIPKVEVSTASGGTLDFGILAEGCSTTREVTLINKSNVPIPVFLKINQGPVKEPLFYWENEANTKLKISTPEAAFCELQPIGHTTGSSPFTAKVTLKAPSLAEMKVKEDVISIKGVLQVCVDSPRGTQVMIASVPMQAEVAVVRLSSLKTEEPLELEANLGESSVAEIPLVNASSIPLVVSLDVCHQEKGFHVVPNLMKIKARTRVTFSLIFKPQTLGRLESKVTVCVEPKGIEYEIKIAGVCREGSRAEVVQQNSIHFGSEKHRTVSKCMSNPTALEQRKEEDEPALESNKASFVWGTVSLNSTSTQKCILKNVRSTLYLTLHVEIRGDQCFQIVNDKGKNVRELQDVLKPFEEISIKVAYTPTSVSPHKGIIVCKPQGFSKRIVFQIPVAGYGGSSSLAFPDVNWEGNFTIPNLIVTEPALLNTFIHNKGSRAAFVKLQLFKDQHCKEPLPLEQASVQPMELVVGAMDKRALVIVIATNVFNYKATPGCIGYLQVTSGDEILRKGFRRQQSKKAVAPKGVSDPSLLSIDWDVHYSGEELVLEDLISPHVEDRKVFYKGITRKKIGIHAKEKSGLDNSSTVFVQLAAEDTVVSDVGGMSICDRNIVHSPPEKQQSSADKSDTSESSWSVEPSSLVIDSNDKNSHAVLMINHTTQPQALEVVSKTSWLNVIPRELILPSMGSASLKISLNQINVKTSQTTATVQICSENGDRSFQVHLRLVPISSKTNNKENPVAPKAFLSRESKRNVSKITDHNQDKSRVMRQSNEAENSNKILSSKLRSSKVEVASTSLAFPATRVMKDNHMKITLHNRGSTDHQVTARVSSAPFFIRHPQFQIKGGHFVSIPVYFKPQKQGKYTAKLHFVVVEDHKQMNVMLLGEAV